MVQGGGLGRRSAASAPPRRTRSTTLLLLLAALLPHSLSDGSQIRERRLQVSAVDVLREDGSGRTATLVQTSSVGWDTTIYPHCVFVDNPYFVALDTAAKARIICIVFACCLARAGR